VYVFLERSTRILICINIQMFLNKEVKRYQSTKIRKYESTKSPVDESFKVMEYFTRCTDITDITLTLPD
jgi:hypothetical protein